MRDGWLTCRFDDLYMKKYIYMQPPHQKYIYIFFPIVQFIHLNVKVQVVYIVSTMFCWTVPFQRSAIHNVYKLYITYIYTNISFISCLFSINGGGNWLFLTDIQKWCSEVGHQDSPKLHQCRLEVLFIIRSWWNVQELQAGLLTGIPLLGPWVKEGPGEPHRLSNDKFIKHFLIFLCLVF